MNTIIDDGVEFEVLWDGSFDGAWWRDYSDTGPADPPPERHLTDEIRAYLSSRSPDWRVSKDIRLYLRCTHDEMKNLLRQLVDRGEVESQRRHIWQREYRCYRWKGTALPVVVPDGCGPLVTRRLTSQEAKRTRDRERRATMREQASLFAEAS